ncbi:MAG TPA: hypothetical protein ENN97_04000, partial [Phycisphaerales bacterium]|nr:hypothetical protein [Phycisphaerales bacterium]
MKTVVYCNCSQANLIPESSRKAALDALDAAGVEYLYTDDLCGLCAEQNPELRKSLHNQETVVLACFPRTIRALLNRAGLAGIQTLQTVNLRIGNPDTVTSALNLNGVRPGKRIALTRQNTDWQPWYPLIDEAR